MLNYAIIATSFVVGALAVRLGDWLIRKAIAAKRRTFRDHLDELIYLEGYRGDEAERQYIARKYIMEHIQ